MGLKLLPKGIVKFLLKTGIVNVLTKFFYFSKKTLQEVVDELTDNETLKAVLCYSFGDYGKCIKGLIYAQTIYFGLRV